MITCNHDYENPKRLSRFKYECRLCGQDISLDMYMLYQLEEEDHDEAELFEIEYDPSPLLQWQSEYRLDFKKVGGMVHVFQHPNAEIVGIGGNLQEATIDLNRKTKIPTYDEWRLSK